MVILDDLKVTQEERALVAAAAAGATLPAVTPAEEGYRCLSSKKNQHASGRNGGGVNDGRTAFPIGRNGVSNETFLGRDAAGIGGNGWKGRAIDAVHIGVKVIF